MIWQKFTLGLLRRYHAHRLKKNPSPLAQLLWQCWQSAAASDHGQLLAVDLEMSALTTHEGEIVAAGWVAIDGQNIRFGSAEHHLVSANNSVGDSATIHHLRDCDLAAGGDSESMVAALLRAANGRTLLFHNASLDLAFLNQLCRQLCGVPLLLPHRDTLLIEKRRLEASNQILKANSLTLFQCRQRYHLPDFAGHNALADALATAELYLAQNAYRRGRNSRH
ncbi:3'-5' exonuclease [Halioxenophilus sp. WMMB6]|uniref:3'-5' exonuclease n=1 Tax=Halioxenophilus sp. WMMB6 TaxID=3073815 RepID=UPI00295F2285|nr:3'-5' exonuclease [Halioxenophilus sp. WMMB6]